MEIITLDEIKTEYQNALTFDKEDRDFESYLYDEYMQVYDTNLQLEGWAKR